MKKAIAFDLDGTLAASKSPVEDVVLEQLEILLNNYDVCVISGGKFEQFKKQLLNGLNIETNLLRKLHIMPTCGTKYFVYDTVKNEWEKVYSEDIPVKDIHKIKQALIKGFKDLKYEEDKIYGETIEDRGSQITYSVYGQDIVDELGIKGVEKKEAWDPDNSKKVQLTKYIQPLIPDYEVRVGGVTSIDVTKKGIDKAYGMRKLIELLGISKDEVLFIGDRIIPGGNDYPVKEYGIDCIQISDWQQTSKVIETINKLA